MAALSYIMTDHRRKSAESFLERASPNLPNLFDILAYAVSSVTNTGYLTLLL